MQTLEQKSTIAMPRSLFRSMINTYQRWQEFSLEFEDFLLAHNKHFLEKMYQARQEHLQGNTRDLDELKQELS